MDIQINSIVFTKLGKFGDFNHMICSNNYNNALFIYNDNVESYLSKSYKKGAGNAIIRQYNKYNLQLDKPHSAGIPTGTLEDGGFDELTNDNKLIIDSCITDIENIIKEYNLTELYYSTNDLSGIIGQSIFEVDDNVRSYITNEIHKLSKNPIKLTKEF